MSKVTKKLLEEGFVSQLPEDARRVHGGLEFISEPKYAFRKAGVKKLIKKRKSRKNKKTKGGKRKRKRKSRKVGGKTSMRTTGLIPPGAGSATLTPTPQYKPFF